MAPIDRQTIESNLLDKGFKLNSRGRDHKFFYFYYKGKKTIIRTKISTGTKYKEYGDDLINKMKYQLALDNFNQTKKFLMCPLSEEEYIDILITKNKIS